MKVLHIIGSLDENAGGPSRSVPQTCTELSKLGVTIEIITRPSVKPVKVPENENLKVRFMTIRELQKWSKSITKSNVDLIHLQHVWDPYVHVMARAARKAGIPYLVTPRGMLEPWIMKRNAWKKKLAMALYQRKDIQKAELIHTTCELEKKNVQALGLQNPITIIPNGLNLSEVPAPKGSYGSKKLVFLSRIHPKKGIELLLEAWKQLAIKDWSLEIAGNGEEEYIKQLNEKIKTEQIKSVSLVGPQYNDAKWEFLKSADLFVLPTYSENFGIAVAEALAVGVPVITTTGTPWEELKTHNCGWWIDLSVENLVATIKQATLTPQEQLQQMGKNGQQLIASNYDIKAVAKAIEDMYRTILTA